MTEKKNVSVEDSKPKGIYLFPNLLTTAALIAGFYAIVAAMDGRFTAAAVAIFIAMFFDGLDGRVARLIGAESEFGAEYDSFSDMLSFGIAPALVIFSWSLYSLNKLGWIVAVIYVIAAALRLARFNTKVGVADNRFFQGLSSPCAASLIASVVWIGDDFALVGADYRWLALALTLVASVLMVSNVRYHSFKGVGMKDKVSYAVYLLLILLIIAIVFEPPIVLFGMAFTYALSGPLWAVKNLVFARGK